VSNTTGSVAGVLSLMTGDKEFMKDRGLRRRKKAKNVLQGFEQGAASLFTGIVEGFTGIVTQPYKEIKSQGAIGIFPGLLKGITGIVTKPLSGLLDTVSKSAEVKTIHRRASKTQLEVVLKISREQGHQERSTTRTWSSKSSLSMMRCTMTP
jgi:hypothetical protein